MNNIPLSPFHLAIPVHDLTLCKTFYIEQLGCSQGRCAAHWVDLNFYGHQLVLHQTETETTSPNKEHNPVDGHNVPVPHFGVVLPWEHWQTLATRLQAINTQFIIEPYIRFKGQVGEQGTFFFLDPSNNALEFKSFKNPEQLFATE